MTVSPPGHEHYFEELAQLASAGAMLDTKVVGDLRRRYDTDQLSALQAVDQSLYAIYPNRAPGNVSSWPILLKNSLAIRLD